MDVLYNVLYIHTYWLPISIFEYQLWIKITAHADISSNTV